MVIIPDFPDIYIICKYLTVGVLIQVWGALKVSSNFVRAKMASATAALVTVAQVSDKHPC